MLCIIGGIGFFVFHDVSSVHNNNNHNNKNFIKFIWCAREMYRSTQNNGKTQWEFQKEQQQKNAFKRIS